MGDQKEQPQKDDKRSGKRAAEEAERITKEQLRKRAYLVKEETIEKASKARKTRQMEKQTAEEIRQSDKDQTRKKIYFAKEQALAEAQEARKLKAKNQPPR